MEKFFVKLLPFSHPFIYIIRCNEPHLSIKRKKLLRISKKVWEKFGGSEKNRTFAPAFALKRVKHQKKEFFETFT